MKGRLLAAAGAASFALAGAAGVGVTAAMHAHADAFVPASAASGAGLPTLPPTPSLSLPTLPPAPSLPIPTPTLGLPLPTPTPTPKPTPTPPPPTLTPTPTPTPSPIGGVPTPTPIFTPPPTPTPTPIPGGPNPPPIPGGGGTGTPTGGGVGGGGTGAIGGGSIVYSLNSAPVAAHSGTAGRTPLAAGGGVLAALDQLTLSMAHTQLTPGSSDDFTVTLLAAGQPVSGAPIAMSLLSAPGQDAAVTPATGTTDATGTFHGVLHLSQQSGDHLLLATSGLYSDEATIAGRTQQSAIGGFIGNLPFGIGGWSIAGNPVVLWLAVATMLMVAFGVVLNVKGLRRFLWSLTLGRFVNRRHATRAA